MRRATPLARLVSTAATASVLAVSLGSAPVHAAPADEDPMAQAEALYREGEGSYSAADYNQAIEQFTAALKIVTAEGRDEPGDYQIRGLLMVNIAKAHDHAHDIDRDVSHLRQALSIYDRFINEAPTIGYKANDVEDAKAERSKIQAKLDEIEAREAAAIPAPAPAPTQTEARPPRDDGNEAKARTALGLGIGLTITGVALLGGGAGALIWGTGFESAAEDEVQRDRTQAGVALDAPFTPNEQQFIDDEIGKGNAWIGAGAALMVVGVAGIGVGAWQLAKYKKLSKTARLQPVLGPQYAGFSLTGEF